MLSLHFHKEPHRLFISGLRPSQDGDAFLQGQPQGTKTCSPIGPLQALQVLHPTGTHPEQLRQEGEEQRCTDSVF